MPSPVLLTIDTEIAWRHHAAGLDLDTMLRRSIDPAGVGIGHQLDRLAAHGLKACFFVDPMPALAYGVAPVRALVGRIVAAGQEVQLHLHPNWAKASADDRRASGGFELGALPGAEQRRLIGQARDLLIEAGAPPPVAFRAGSFAANDDTIDALAALGFRFDSSHDGAHAPDPSAIGLPRDLIAPVAHRGLIETPVSLFEEWPGRLRHCQITAMSLAEMAGVLDHAEAENHPLTCFVGHSFELATRDGRRPNGMLVRRFEALCALLAERRAAHPTRFFADLDVPPGRAARPMPWRAGRTAARMAAQAAANLFYDLRP
ncbi:MAG: polysaccharide deacetylase [Sphingomonas sanxanigenens]|uniref:Polysaccharide deacetylase n=1 Tax=Sphingomonas sanxanigenens TaxID=397260 RepID=A0A2W5AE15_9SPHN|nr:MAG: polysaccharide deacetylase [Sphingomonas sanxanigenens]